MSQYSKEYLGYIAYGYLLFLLYVLYKFNFSIVQDIAVKVSSVILLFISLILFQSLVIDGELSGKIGNMLITSLSPFIGLVGLWIFVIIGLLLSFVLLIETDDINTNKFKEKIIDTFSFTYPKNKIKSLPPKLNRSSEVQDQKVTIKEVGDTAEICIEQEDFIKEPISTDFSKITREEDFIQQEIFESDIVEKPTLRKKTEEIASEVEKEKQPINKVQETNEEKKRSVIVQELEENKKLLSEIEVGNIEKPKDFQLPSTKIFQAAPKESKQKVNEAVIDQKIKDLLEKLKMFKIDGDVVRTYTYLSLQLLSLNLLQM